MEVFARRLRERAAALELSHSDIARRAGLSERRYSHYVNGVREPDLATLVRIAEALRVTPDFLLGVIDPQPASLRATLMDRLNLAAEPLSGTELEMMIVQIEALAARRRAKPAGV